MRCSINTSTWPSFRLRSEPRRRVCPPIARARAGRRSPCRGFACCLAAGRHIRRRFLIPGEPPACELHTDHQPGGGENDGPGTAAADHPREGARLSLGRQNFDALKPRGGGNDVADDAYRRRGCKQLAWPPSDQIRIQSDLGAPDMGSNSGTHAGARDPRRGATKWVGAPQTRGKAHARGRVPISPWAVASSCGRAIRHFAALGETGLVARRFGPELAWSSEMWYSSPV